MEGGGIIFFFFKKNPHSSNQHVRGLYSKQNPSGIMVKINGDELLFHVERDVSGNNGWRLQSERQGSENSLVRGWPKMPCKVI